ncbi:glycosyltransferase family A protein [Pseudomonadota bacterium]
MKQKLGCWWHERWRTELALALPRIVRSSAWRWESLCNRSEKLDYDDSTKSYSCAWEDTSRLTVARIFPHVGGRLLKECVRNWPVRFSTEVSVELGDPEVTFVLGVRGLGRLPQFRTTLASLMGQTDCSIEIIVVEQDWEQRFQPEIPPGVGYIFTKISHPQMPFNRSWALNVGTRAAKGRVVVLHDADMIVPQRLARGIANYVREDVDGMRIPRFIFYLDRSNSARLTETRDIHSVDSVETIVQNNRTPIALTREALIRIGGHEEAFYGWGAEDNEFIDRARTLNLKEGAMFPLIHLWHETPPKKLGDRNRRDLEALMSVPSADRISALQKRPFGEMKPAVAWKPVKGD